MYSALLVAKHIIRRCDELGRTISNLKLQKILYFVQAEFLRILVAHVSGKLLRLGVSVRLSLKYIESIKCMVVQIFLCAQRMALTLSVKRISE